MHVPLGGDGHAGVVKLNTCLGAKFSCCMCTSVIGIASVTVYSEGAVIPKIMYVKPSLFIHHWILPESCDYYRALPAKWT